MKLLEKHEKCCRWKVSNLLTRIEVQGVLLVSHAVNNR